jgi:hypothetical protein
MHVSSSNAVAGVALQLGLVLQIPRARTIGNARGSRADAVTGLPREVLFTPLE